MKPLKNQFGSFARFNPGVQFKDGIVHMLYRATNSDIRDTKNYISYIGYAKLDTETHILYDSNEKVIYPTLPEESKGCEDPRIVEFEDSFYIFYTAFDGIKAYLHRVEPNIQLDYFESFDELLSINSWGNYENKIKTSTIMKCEHFWENQKIGGIVPPIKTEKGWLFLYHAVDDNFVYRGSVALLDLENPSKVIA